MALVTPKIKYQQNNLNLFQINRSSFSHQTEYEASRNEFNETFIIKWNTPYTIVSFAEFQEMGREVTF